jgi:alpha-ketoglutarate-dependent dioxygenase FTO
MCSKARKRKRQKDLAKEREKKKKGSSNTDAEPQLSSSSSEHQTLPDAAQLPSWVDRSMVAASAENARKKKKKKKRRCERQKEEKNKGSGTTDASSESPFEPQGKPAVAPSSSAQQDRSAAVDTANAPVVKPKKMFLTATDGEDYHRVLKKHYRGFCFVSARDVRHPSSFHENADRALEKLRDAGYYQYDMVMAGGKHLSRTFVKRTLVGDAGITYKYLGLRLFAHAWSGPGVQPVFRSIRDMNRDMIRMTQQKLQGAGQGGSCQYNLTLINYMEPSSAIPLKEEEFYGMGKASVSWHADSGLQDHSSIGVYHTLPTQKASKWDWRIALRRNPDDNPEDAPPVVVPTRSGDLYFLLGEFNHTHQHMVLAGSVATRISSTHRVAHTESDTYDYIRSRVKQALKTLKRLFKQPAETWKAQDVIIAQQVLTEVEFEWVAQYWVQGAQHDVMHTWWQVPVRELEKAWNSLEGLTYKLYKACVSQASSPVLSRDLVAALLDAFKARKELRTKWDERRADKIYKRRISRPFQPVARPIFADDAKSLPKDLTAAIRELTQVLSRYDGSTVVEKKPAEGV